MLEPPPAPEAARRSAQRMPLKVVHEDAALLVIDKPAGPGRASGRRPAGRHAAERRCSRHAPALAGVPRAGIVHRLDKDTSGLLVVAKTVIAQADLVEAARRPQHAPRLPRGGAGRSAGERQDRRADRARPALAHAHGGDRTAASPRAPRTACSSASAAPRWSNAAWRPGARTRSACISSTSAIRWSATPVYRRGTRARHGVPAAGAACRRARAARIPRSGKTMAWQCAAAARHEAPARRAAQDD